MELMRNILAEIHGGKMHFKPDNESAEALVQFQAIAKRIESAKERGYIRDAKVQRSRARESYNLALQVIAVGPLTFEGEQLLTKTQEKKESPPPQGNIVQLKPSFYGMSIDLVAAFKWLRQKWRS